MTKTTTTTCLCGCGTQTKSTWAAGHDQREIGRIIRACYGSAKAFVQAHREKEVNA